MVICIISNDELGIEYPVKINELTGALLFKSDRELLKSDQLITLRPKIIELIKGQKDLFEPFIALGNFLQTDPENFLRTFLLMIAREDRKGYKLLCTDKIKEADFISKFRKYQRFYIPTKKILNVIAPDILACALCHELYFKYNGKTEFEVPAEFIPFVLPIAGVVPYEAPEGFDPSVPYESDVYEEPKEGFFEKFSFLKGKKEVH